MRISKKGEYALLALIYIALNYQKNVTQAPEIVRDENIPERFLEQILLVLKKAGFLRSKRGVSGGYTLSRSPVEIKLGEIIRLIDGPLAPIGCVSKFAHEDCSKEKTCGLRSIMLDVRNATAAILDHITLDDVCRRVKGAPQRRRENLMYYI